MKKNSIKIRSLVVVAIMSALGYVLMLLEFSIPIMPGFIKFDFSELPAIITSFALGPIPGILVCLFKNVLHLFNTSTYGVGELSNFILGAVFVCVAGSIYKKNKTFKFAIIGTILGSLVMALFSVLSNYYIVYPFYAKVFMPMDVIVNMYSSIWSRADNLLKALFLFNVPFNFIKGLTDAFICFLCYKKLSPILKGNKINKKSVDKIK